MDGKLAFAGAGMHPSEAIANLAMSTRGFQLRWGVLEHPRRIGRAVLLGQVWGEAPRPCFVFYATTEKSEDTHMFLRLKMNICPDVPT